MSDECLAKAMGAVICGLQERKASCENGSPYMDGLNTLALEFAQAVIEAAGGHDVVAGNYWEF